MTKKTKSAPKSKAAVKSSPPASQSTNLDINDLVVVRQVIDASTKAGVFTAQNLSIVGAVYDKINTIVEKFLAAEAQPKPEIVKEAQPKPEIVKEAQPKPEIVKEAETQPEIVKEFMEGEIVEEELAKEAPPKTE